MEGDKILDFLVYVISLQNLSDLFMLLLFNHCLHSGESEERE